MIEQIARACWGLNFDDLDGVILESFSFDRRRALLVVSIWGHIGDGGRYEITVHDPIDHHLPLGFLRPPEVETSGPLLAPYADRIVEVAVSRRPGDVAGCIGALLRAYHAWRVFPWSIPAFPRRTKPEETLERGEGVIGVCPAALADAYVGVLEAHGAAPRAVERFHGERCSFDATHGWMRLGRGVVALYAPPGFVIGSRVDAVLLETPAAAR